MEISENQILENEIIEAMGTPTITVRDRDGNIVEKFTSRNMIVKLGKAAIVQLLTGGFTGVKIAKCALGTGGVNPATPFTPIAPTATDSALVALVAASMKNVDGFSYDNVDKTSATFATLFLSENVNEIVSEAGLFLSNNDLFARYTFPSAYLKSDRGYSLELAWNVKLI